MVLEEGRLQKRTQLWILPFVPTWRVEESQEAKSPPDAERRAGSTEEQCTVWDRPSTAARSSCKQHGRLTDHFAAATIHTTCMSATTPDMVNADECAFRPAWRGR
mmetsp:Transcript_50194/g.94018  ORF Transcript_50194/g.94018 Transcript_50194/m.94018 type:complete len:105 (-) Transcript_50194:117-431(-)